MEPECSREPATGPYPEKIYEHERDGWGYIVRQYSVSPHGTKFYQNPFSSFRGVARGQTGRWTQPVYIVQRTRKSITRARVSLRGFPGTEFFCKDCSANT
jgi:hypothetical protein